MENMEKCILEVPFKSNGEKAQFFNDHVEFSGQRIMYSEIEELAAGSNGVTIHTYVGIPLGRSFDGSFTFKMKSGKKFQIIMNSVSLFGIPIIRNPRKTEKLFPPLFQAVYSIVAQNMAQKYVDLIRGGSTVEVAGLEINSIEAKPKAKAKAKASKEVAIINKENYRECQITHTYGVVVFDKPGNTLWSSSVWSNKNILLIPYILDAIFS